MEMMEILTQIERNWNAGLAMIEGEMEKMVRNFSNGIGTERGEMSESRGECGGCSDRDDDGQGQGDE